MSKLLKIISWFAILMPISIGCGRGVADINLSAIAILFIVHSFIEKDWKWINEKWIQIAFALWGYTILRSLFVEDIIFSLSKTFPFIRFILFAACMQFIVSRSSGTIKRIMISLALTVGFLAVDALFQYVTGYDIIGKAYVYDGYIRLTGLYNKMIVGTVIATLAAPVLSVIYFKITNSKDIFQIISSALFAVVIYLAVFLSGERSAFIQMTCAIFLIFCCKKHTLWLVGIIGAIIGAAMFLKPSLMDRQINSIIEIINNFSQSPYGMLWISGIKMGMSHFILGVGPRYFEQYCSHYVSICNYHAHNIYIEWFSEFGLIGLVLFLYLFFILFRKAIAGCCKLNYDQTKFVVIGIIIAISIKLLPLPSSSFFKNWWAVPLWFMIGFVLCILNRKNIKS